jgi:hypothetical protein
LLSAAESFILSIDQNIFARGLYWLHPQNPIAMPLIKIEQTSHRRSSRVGLLNVRNRMRTAKECRAKALEKLGLASANPQHRRRFTDDANAWFFLASRLEVGEAILSNARAEDTRLGHADTQAAKSHRSVAAS